MRILHILDHGLPLQSGYTFRTRAIVKAQMAQGWEVACLTGARHAAPGHDPEVVDGIRFFRTPKPAAGPSPLREWRGAGGPAARPDRGAGGRGRGPPSAHTPGREARAGVRGAAKRGRALRCGGRAFLGGGGGGRGQRGGR